MAGGFCKASAHLSSLEATNVGSTTLESLLQALAVLEWRAGDYERAQELFSDATGTCGPHAPLLAAWALMEVLPLL